jgi:aminoglycoside phosphotransferase (APT) family kinase protein
VVKQYGTNLSSYYREHALLPRLSTLLVPRMVTGSRPGHLRLGYIDGINGRDVVAAGQATQFLRAMGHFLQHLQRIDPQSVADILPGEGPVLVHGDYAPYNCLMDRGGADVLAILDWEVAHLGSPVLDLAWCEWQFRATYPRHVWALSSLFDAYGMEPTWSLRHDTMLARLDELRRGAEQADQPDTAAAWTKLLRKTEAFTERM